mmetsp:Transcript_65489/g.189799  ORF Transcript_65489/g.189799 Transcript_65489/m.189799 type:complete len:310 (+) Transcript_65489:1029-1958(+)
MRNDVRVRQARANSQLLLNCFPIFGIVAVAHSQLLHSEDVASLAHHRHVHCAERARTDPLALCPSHSEAAGLAADVGLRSEAAVASESRRGPRKRLVLSRAPKCALGLRWARRCRRGASLGYKHGAIGALWRGAWGGFTVRARVIQRQWRGLDQVLAPMHSNPRIDVGRGGGGGEVKPTPLGADGRVSDGAAVRCADACAARPGALAVPRHHGQRGGPGGRRSCNSNEFRGIVALLRLSVSRRLSGSPAPGAQQCRTPHIVRHRRQARCRERQLFAKLLAGLLHEVGLRPAHGHLAVVDVGQRGFCLSS